MGVVIDVDFKKVPVPKEVQIKCASAESFIACMFDYFPGNHCVATCFKIEPLKIQCFELAVARIQAEIKNFRVTIHNGLVYMWVFFSDRFRRRFVTRQAQMICREMKRVNVDLVYGSTA